MKRLYLIHSIRILLIFLFAYVATSKIIDYQKFSVQLQQSPILTNFSREIAIAVPVVELILVLFLVTDRFMNLAFYGCYSLMVIFTSYITVIIWFSDTIPCSCGGILEQMSWNQHLVFNVFISVFTIIAILLNRPKETTN